MSISHGIIEKRVFRATAAHSVNRDALQSLLHDCLAKAGPQTSAAILSDAVSDLVTAGTWTEADARTVLYSANCRIDRVVSQ